MLGILFALGAALSSGIEQVLRRHVLIKEDSLCYTFAFGLFAAIVLLPLFFLRFEAPANNMSWLLVLASGTLWILFSVTLFKAFSYLEVSIASPITKLRLFFILIMGVIFLNESLTTEKVLGTVLIFVGVIALTYEKGRKKLDIFKNKGVILLILSAFIISVVLLIDKYAMNFFNPETFLAPVYLLGPILLFPVVLKRKSHLKSIFKKALGATFLTALLSVGYYYLILNAFKFAEASTIIPITELSTLVAVVGGIFFLKEVKHVKRKIIAAAIIILGTIIIALA